MGVLEGRTSLPAPELLSPAGGPDAFAAALGAGADAIYLGRGSFNARRKAENFDDASFERACTLAHLAGARVYVTVNIAIKDGELADALGLVKSCTELGADAFIIQDWGLFALVRALMPSVETHISTQANIHDGRGALWCRDEGARRVTLSRELSVAEIARIHAEVPDLDLEVFAHGAICFCYSGICLLSSFACSGRSANRGMCAQPCRLPYALVDSAGRELTGPGRERALCPRDNNTMDILPELVRAGAGALKLEGRMKAPEYVYSVTDAYRRQLDDAVSGTVPDEAEALSRARQLKRCFNRDFTHAYQSGTSGDEMMSYERSNNRGQVVGEVVGFTPRSPRNRSERFRERDKGPRGTARLHLSEPVGAGDLLELRHDSEPDRFLTAIAREDAPAGSLIDVDVPRAMPRGCRVRLIRSQSALDATSAVISRAYPRRRPVHVRVTAHVGEPFSVELSCVDDPSLAARAEGFVVEAARTRAVTSDDLVEHVGRMGSSPFEATSFDIDLEPGCGMGFSAVHRVRARACDLLREAVLEPARLRSRAVARTVIPRSSAEVLSAAGLTPSGGPSADAPLVCALAADLPSARAAADAGAGLVYMAIDDLESAGFDPEGARAAGIVPVLDEVCRSADRARIDRWISPGTALAVGNVSELAAAALVGARPEIRSCIPVHNAASISFLERKGARGFWLSPELTLGEIAAIAPRSSAPVGLMVSGRPRVMTSEHCILQVADACIHDCRRCRLRGRELFLKNIDGKLLPVRSDARGRSRLFAGDAIDLTPQIPQLLDAGVSRFLVDGTLLGPREIASQVSRARRALDASRAGVRPAPRQRGTTTGCLFVGVD